MPARIPDEFLPQRRTGDGTSALQHAFNAEGAFTLGKLGREVEAALATLAEIRESGEQAQITAKVHECANVVWRYFVQREMHGLMSHEPVIEYYCIPPEVLNKVGAFPHEVQRPV